MTVQAIPAATLYSDYVNAQWVRLLNLLEMNVRYARCAGAELFTSGGDRVLDFSSGGTNNLGHNHPRLLDAIRQELDAGGPATLHAQVPEATGELASRLCRLAGGRLNKAFFCSSAGEAIDAAITFARAHTGRTGLLSARGASHGSLSLMDDPARREGHGPLLPGAETIPFGDLPALREALASRRFAAFIVEPIQVEAGVRLPFPEYLAAAQRLCRQHGSLFVLDEARTGMFRTGPFIASHGYGIQPDMVVLGKLISGGLVPVGAVLLQDKIHESISGSAWQPRLHRSGGGGNALAMRAGLAALDVLEGEELGDRAAALGAELRRRLWQLLAPCEIVRDVRGAGLVCGIEFQEPDQLSLRITFEAFQRIHPGMFGQMLVKRLFRQEKILTQVCANNPMVLNVAPPLVAGPEHIETFVAAIARVVEAVHSSGAFWSDALGWARRTLNI